MTAPIYARNRSTADEIAAHLRACDTSFSTALSARLDIGAYAAKLAVRAERFEAWMDSRLAGLVAVYCDAPDKRLAFVTNVSVLPQMQQQGIATRLLGSCVAHTRQEGFGRCGLEVEENNGHAVALYERHGFSPVRRHDGLLEMVLDLRLESAG